MSSFLDRLIGKKSSPAQSAKDRLKLVLVTDRTSMSPDDLRKMQQEILAVIRKYCVVNDEAVELKFEQRERENFLVADIPIAGMSTPEQDGASEGTLRVEMTVTGKHRAAPAETPVPAAETPEAGATTFDPTISDIKFEELEEPDEVDKNQAAKD